MNMNTQNYVYWEFAFFFTGEQFLDCLSLSIYPNLAVHCVLCFIVFLKKFYCIIFCYRRFANPKKPRGLELLEP